MNVHSDLLPDATPHLAALAKQAFEVLAGMIPEIRSAGDQIPDSFEVEASVSYEGEQDIPSRLLIRANTRFAVDFSQRFLGLPALAEVDDDVLDAMGELANTVGGNFKGLFSADTNLSTPEIFKVNQIAEPNATGTTLAEVDYSFEGDGYCLVRLVGPKG